MKGPVDRFASLLRAYPKSYRERRGEEILDTLREDVQGNGRMENLRVGLDIVGHGVRLRLAVASDQLAGRVLIAAALPGVMMAAVVALVMPVFGQVVPDLRYGPTSWGPDTAIWPALCALWVLGCLAAVVFPRRGRSLAGACIVATLIARFALPIAPWGLPAGSSLCIALALPCLLAPRTSSSRSHRKLALASGAVVLAAILVDVLYNTSYGAVVFYTEFSRSAPYVAGAVVLFSVILMLSRRRVEGLALAILSIPWLLLPAIKPGLLAVSSTTSVVSVAAASVIGLGLLGLWVTDLWKSHQLLP
jgi:hypothetical protein